MSNANLGPIFLYLSLLPFLWGCAPAGQGNMERRVARAEDDLRDVRSLLAETRASLISIERDIRVLKGSLEDVTFRADSAQTPEQLGELERRVEQLGRRVPPPALVPVPQLEEDESLALGLEDDARRRVWMNTFTRIREGNYQGALEQLSSAEMRLTTGEEFVRVLFWTGLCHEGLGRANEAVTSFHRIGSEFADSPRAPVALLRLASVFIRLRDFESAKLTLESIRLRYAGTPEAQRATERLRDLR